VHHAFFFSLTEIVYQTHCSSFSGVLFGHGKARYTVSY
jgi:hypothetical protein